MVNSKQQKVIKDLAAITSKETGIGKEQISKQDILRAIGKVYKIAHFSALKDSLFEELDGELEMLSNYFKTTKLQTLLISTIFTLNYKGEAVEFNDLIGYYGCNPMKILEYKDDLDFLHSQGILKKERSRSSIRLAGANDKFYVHEKVSLAILQNQPMPIINKEEVVDILDLLEQLYDSGEHMYGSKASTFDQFSEFEKALVQNSHFALIQRIKQFHFEIEDAYFYTYLIWRNIIGKEHTDIASVLDYIFDSRSQRYIYMQKFLSGESPLIKNDLIEIVEASFFSDTLVELTEHSYELLNDCDIKLGYKKKKKENIITPEAIPYRKLVFDKLEMHQFNLLQNLLEEDKLKETQNKLVEKCLPKGVTVLLHGAPGTGKTEIVKQLAKATDREIMKVDISNSKSMWFGESEKITKRIFADYKAYAQECKRTPILLFNEADALFSKRKDVGSSNIAQTENTIQNIILEELENFGGILIATTNLATNFDPAFERRFLFKIAFLKPASTTRAKIWKSKLDYLTEQDCQKISEKFDFSGGQIENIVRKSKIKEVVDGSSTNLDTLIWLCNQEYLENKRNKIGFNYSKSK